MPETQYKTIDKCFVMDVDPSTTDSRIGKSLDRGELFNIQGNPFSTMSIDGYNTVIWYPIEVKDGSQFYISHDSLVANTNYLQAKNLDDLFK